MRWPWPELGLHGTGLLLHSGALDVLVYFFGVGLRTMVLWHQASFMRFKKSWLIAYPDLSPITASLPHRGHSAVPALALSGLSKLLTSRPDQATISMGLNEAVQ